MPGEYEHVTTKNKGPLNRVSEANLQFSLKRLKPLLLHFSVFMKKIAQKKTS
jgi:hypothetical protein